MPISLEKQEGFQKEEFSLLKFILKMLLHLDIEECI